MNIPLTQFEQIVDEKILQRGLAYFKAGAITEFSEISTGEYEAIVEGTEEYTVQLTVNNNTITAYNCDCPYDMGPVCKHVVAVIFYLQQDELELNVTDVTKPKKKKTKSVSQQIKELLNSISRNELIEFVQDNTKKNKKFRNYFLASFGHLSQQQSKEFYQKQIHSILDTAAGRDGFIGWNDMKYVANSCEPFLENAEKYLVNNNFENVFFISTALLEEMTKAYEYGYDSNGDLGYFVDAAMELLSKLAKEKLPTTLKREIFEYCIAAFNDKLFEGWDWHIEILYTALEFTDNEKGADIIIDCLDKVEGQYEKERAQSFKLILLKKFKGDEEVEKYIGQNISNSSIRKSEIEKAFDKENFERVIQLSKDGIKCDEKDKPGLAMDWYDWLLKAAIAQNNTPKIIEIARYRLIDSFGGTLNYYKLLKDNIEVDKWHPFLELIIKEIAPKTKWTYTELIRQIYINEQWWDRLFEMVKQNLSMENIEQNEKYLAKDYAKQLVDFYSERLIVYIEQYIGRSHYQTACRYLRRMKKLGGNEEVIFLKDWFRKEYPQRRALMEELNKV